MDHFFICCCCGVGDGDDDSNADGGVVVTGLRIVMRDVLKHNPTT